MSGKKTRVIPKSFFQGNVVEVAQKLLGKFLCRKLDSGIEKYLITEVEAYDGFLDTASHAHKGRTVRNDPMFAEGGIWYVYLCYGIHWMLNIVTGPADYPAAVLIRGVGHYDGPGKLTKSLSITKQLNRMEASVESGLWIEDHQLVIAESFIKSAPRIGIAYADDYWRNIPYRYFIDKIKLKEIRLG